MYNDEKKIYWLNTKYNNKTGTSCYSMYWFKIIHIFSSSNNGYTKLCLFGGNNSIVLYFYYVQHYTTIFYFKSK